MSSRSGPGGLRFDQDGDRSEQGLNKEVCCRYLGLLGAAGIGAGAGLGAGAGAALGAEAAAGAEALAGADCLTDEPTMGTRTIRGAFRTGGGTIHPLAELGSVTGGATVPSTA